MSLSLKHSAYLAWIVVCIVWGTTYLAIRVALETIPPFLMASCRWLTAGLCLTIALVARGERMPGPAAWPSLAVLGVLLMGIGNGGVVWAEQTVPSGLTAVLVAGIPFWMVGVERLMYGGDPITRGRLAGLVVGFAGIVLLVWPELHLNLGGGVENAAGPGPDRFDRSSFLGGVAATQIACLGWAIGSSIARRRQHGENVLAASALQMVCAGVALGAVGLARGEWTELAFSDRTAGALAYLIVAGSIVGYSAYAYALKHLPVATVSLYAYVNPVIAVALGTLLLREPLSSRMLAAAAAVLAGVILVRRG